MKLYGPYKLKNGRETVTIVYDDGTRKTKSYPKYLVEQMLGRELRPDETVDHKDGDFSNNDPSNLQVLKRSTHVALDHSRRSRKVRIECRWCGDELIRKARDLRRKEKLGHAGPFCKSCAGKYARALQLGQVEPYPTQSGTRSEYYKLKDFMK